MEELFTDKGWEALTVKSKITGQTIQIKDYRFNSEIHEYLDGTKVNRATVEVKPVEPVVAAVDSANKRFLELKAIGFRNLKGELKKEYSALKKNLNL